MGKAAQKGILVREAETLEKLSRIKTWVFDKTGTLTQGKPKVSEVWIDHEKDASEIVKWVASAEAASEHSLAQAFKLAASDRKIELSRVDFFRAHPGLGVEAKMENHQILAGSLIFLESNHVDCARLAAIGTSYNDQGKTAVYAAVDGSACAVFGLSDSLRVEAKNVIAQLKASGNRVYLLSGDHKRTVEAVAQELGIRDYQAGLLPHQKEEAVRQLREARDEQNSFVAMVGDGINDAPALAAADVGIALGGGSDIALESAQVILLRQDLTSILDVVHLAERTLKTVKQNLFASFVYNLIGIPVAAGVFYAWTGWRLSPLLAGGAMALSSVSVLMNSLRLRSWDWKVS
jgi:Cu+-exporting ATPase